MVIQGRYIIILMFLVPCMSCAQNYKYDVIDISKANVLGIGLGTSAEEVTNSFGSYDSLKISFDPLVDEDTSKRYYYRKSFFDIEQGEVTGFTVSNREYPINYQQIKVGDPIEAIKTIFPKSYRQLSEEEKTSPEQTLTVCVGNTKEDIVYDIEMSFVFSHEKLKQIVLWTPL